MINLEVPRKFGALIGQSHEIAREVFRPSSRRYDREEHTYPKELDMLRAVIEGAEAGGGTGGAGAAGVRGDGDGRSSDGGNRNGSNMASVLAVAELCWGDVGLLLSMPGQGLGNSAIASVANERQLERFGGRWAAMAITEPDAGSDSAAIRTTARLDGDEYVLNGEKIYVTSGERADLLVVWATLDRSKGRAAIKSFVVPRDAPGLSLIRVEDKLGIRASDTAAFSLEDCRIPKENLLGSDEIDTKQGFAGAMKTFDNTRPLEAAWMADNRKPNSLQASYAKAKAGRSCVDIALGCVELCGSVGYGENELLEKWARDAKILDIFEGTQQIQLLIIARQLLGKTSAELR